MSTKPNTNQITYDTGSNKQDLNNILDTVVPIADYTALRNYTGRATQVRITTEGIAGFFKYDSTDTTSIDNGGTIILAGSKRWKRVFDGAVNVKWFGAKGDWNGTTGTDDSSAVSSAIACLFSENKNTLFFPDGWFYFASTVTVKFDTFRALRFVGTSTAGFTTVRPCGTKISGASGLSALFKFTKTTPTVWGGYSFEAENIDFNGNSLGVGSAILNNVGGAPARPFNVKSCNFVGFQKAIYSDISETGSTTGICQVNITGCSFVANQYGLYAKGQSAIMDLRFVGNVCEQNSLGGICTESGSLTGSFSITDNLLEGQLNAITLRAGRASGNIERNYFEANTGNLIYVILTAALDSNILIANNYYVDCSDASVHVFGKGECKDNFIRSGIKFFMTGGPVSVFNNAGVVVQPSWSPGSIVSFDVSSIQAGNNISPAVLDSGSYVKYSSGYENTPMGYVGYNNGSFSLSNTAATLAPGDAIVAVCLARVVSGSPTCALYVYDSSSSSIGNSSSLITGADAVQSGKWFVMAASVRVGASSVGTAKIGWLISGGAMHVTNTYTYKVASPTDNMTPMYLYLPYVGPLYGSATYDPPSFTSGSGSTTTVTVTGATLGDFVDNISFSNDLQGVVVTGWVSATDTVSVRFQNQTGGTVDLASGTLRVNVRKL